MKDINCAGFQIAALTTPRSAVRDETQLSVPIQIVQQTIIGTARKKENCCLLILPLISLLFSIKIKI